MEEIRDCNGRLACLGNAETGDVICKYRGQKTKARLAVGENFIVEREGIETIITRVSKWKFNVDSHLALATGRI